MSAEYADASGRKALIEELTKRFGQRVQTSLAIREQHGQGEDSYGCFPPDAVVYVETNEEVAEILSLCHRWRVPVIPFGAGSSVEGQLLALQGGISLDLSGMNRILSIQAEDMDCRVQAGVSREQLNQELRHQGLFFPIDPGANASIGGMVATRASGTNAVRYGTMRENVLGLTVVTPQGELVKTGGRARKSSAGYDLTRLYTGSEGTLGVVTEIQLRLHPIPPVIRAATCQFSNLEDAVNTVVAVMLSAIPVARIELLNKLQMQACIQYSKLDEFSASPTLFFEFHGSEGAVAEQVDAVAELVESFDGQGFVWAESTESRNRLWQARHQAYYAARALASSASVLTTDVCVPVSALAEALMDAEQEAESSGLVCPIVGHVGDGNFHMLILFDEEDEQQSAQARRLSRHMVEKALSLGGTCTGEHGIGLGKKTYLKQEHGDAVAIMKALKTTLDPHLIMNPGKLFD